ncbi:hypothetical protein [Nesterenkonia alba]|uniref:hypothetical protein n=1 Tax=Nesterenkonia alba TaxID=515814 RepID=UPI0003B3D70E|nr:hypothetical protein [Nesterenkonia alba]
MGLISLGVGIGIGYVIGTKTGREKFDRAIESARTTAEETWNRPDVQDFVHKASDTASQVAHDVAESSRTAAAYASEAVKKAAEQAAEAAAKAEDAAETAEEKVAEATEAAEEKVEEAAEEYRPPQTKTTYNGDVVSDPGQSTERKGTDWANEGGAKPADQ